jgi:SAM-dependent methyltransferase
MPNAVAAAPGSVLPPPATTPPPAGAPTALPAAPNGFLTASPTLALFLISAAGLFLELLLIRWISTEIRIFAYLQNTVLVVCFLGLGMGCWDSRRPFALRSVLVPLGVLVALIALPQTRAVCASISHLFGGFSDLVVWGSFWAEGWQLVGQVALGLALTFGLMFLLWATFVPVGRVLGRLMGDHPDTIRAYSVNVAGSLAGIWLFVLASRLALPPVAWFAAFAAGVLPLAGSGGRSRRGDAAALAAVVLVSAAASFQPGYHETHWTPYQKLNVRLPDAPREGGSTLWQLVTGSRPIPGDLDGRTYVAVNNHAYQSMLDLRPEQVRTDPVRFPPAQAGYSQYDLPSRFHPAPKRVLIVGAGSGNDAAGALRNGAERVVAVEIDPVIIDLGKRLHPERPYADPRCAVVNDDARSYFATTAERFDVIAFGLLDSHTTTAMTNARLDHYVYTLESIGHARRLLNPGGVMTLSFVVQKPFVGERIHAALRTAFGHDPLAFEVPPNGYGGGHAMFAVADDPDQPQRCLTANPALNRLVRDWQDKAEWRPGTAAAPRPATDDWPYLYLERPSVPTLYLLLAALLIGLFVVGRRVIGPRDLTPSRSAEGASPGEPPADAAGWGRSGWHFFFLGAGFMLLEVQNVSKAAVVLGNTWAVNAVVISGVMVMILLANSVAARLPRLPLGPVYALLVASCLGLYALDLSTFAFLPYATKAAVVGLLVSLPMLFSGVVFVRSFAAAERKDAALGANLVGALVGGLLQSVTFVTGIKALLLIVAALYLVAVLTRPRAAGAPRPAA